MPFISDHDRDRRSATETILLDVPAGAVQHVVTGGREAGEVRHGGARGEPDLTAEGRLNTFVPCGVVAGVIARTDKSSFSEKWSPTPNISRITPISANWLATP